MKRDNCYVKYVSDESYKKSEFEKVILEIKPDVLYLQGLFQRCVLPCLELAKQYSLKVVLAPRGELCAGAFKKKYKKIPYAAVRMTERINRYGNGDGIFAEAADTAGVEGAASGQCTDCSYQDEEG